MSIIVTDLEGTLTTGSSWKGLRSYSIENLSAWRYTRFFAPWIPRYLLVRAGILSRRSAMVEWMQAEVRLFQGLPTTDFNQMAVWVVENVMWPGRRVDVIEELQRLQKDGAKIALVSSAYQPIVNAFARKLDAEPIGTRLIIEADHIMGIQDPLNAYEYKARYIRETFGNMPIAAAYGDTLSDLPMLEMSQEPVAVYPDDGLREIATKSGWRILENDKT
jgi:HAD superfamily phosphoserine phosphatase-like hydrolase